MPRKPSTDPAANSPLSLRLPPEMRAAIVSLAVKEHRSVNAQILHLLEYALEQKAAAGQNPA